MIHIILILSTFLFAHEDLKTVHCSQGSQKLDLTKTGKDTYTLTGTTLNKKIVFKKPKISDTVAKKDNQIFDTYTFSKDKELLVVKRPETKGSVKEIMAEYNGQIFTCQ